MNYRVEDYIRKDGTSPYEDWFMSLDTIAAAKIVVAKLRMEQGNLSNVKWFRGIGEYRLDWGPGYRIYIVFIRKRWMNTMWFPIWKRGIFRPDQEIKGLRGGVHRYAAQASPQIDAVRAEKIRFRTETT